MIVAKVRFAPGSRTAWHSHARGANSARDAGDRMGPVARRRDGRAACRPDRLLPTG